MNPLNNYASGLNWIAPLQAPPAMGDTGRLMKVLHKLKIKSAVGPYPVGTAYVDSITNIIYVTVDGFNWVQLSGAV